MRSQTCSGKGILSLTHNSGHYDRLSNCYSILHIYIKFDNVLILVLIILFVKSTITAKGKDKAVGVVIGALLLTVILFAFLTAYILYYVPSTEQTNASSSITDRENGFIGLTQSLNNAQYEGSYVSQVVPLGYSGVPPFSQPPH